MNEGTPSRHVLTIPGKSKVSVLERLAMIIQPKDRPAPRSFISPKRSWQKMLYSKAARYYPTPRTFGDRTGIKFNDGTVLLRRNDGSLRYALPRVRRTGRIRRAEKALRRLHMWRATHPKATA